MNTPITATESTWNALCSGNGMPDREEFEEWALSQSGAPSKDDPYVWQFLTETLNAAMADQH